MIKNPYLIELKVSCISYTKILDERPIGISQKFGKVYP